MMRLELRFRVQAGEILPFNYQSQLSAWVYHSLSRSDIDFGSWLHDEGFSDGTLRRYKLFSFSSLQPEKFRLLHGKGMLLQSPILRLRLSFWLPEHLRHFVQGLFEDTELRLRMRGECDLLLDMESIHISEPIDFAKKLADKSALLYQSRSPICLSVQYEDERHASYLSPENEDYAQCFAEALWRKYEALRPLLSLPSVEPDAIVFEQIGEAPKSKLITIKGKTDAETKVRGYNYRFRLQAPALLQELAYYGGFGEKTSMGFGFVDLLSSSEA